MQASPNYDTGSGIFVNEIETPLLVEDRSQWSLAWEFFFGGHTRRQPAEYERPVVEERSGGDFGAGRSDAVARLTWLGHSTAVLEIAGRVVLIDPVFSLRVSPFSWIGPKRFHKTPIEVQDLPDVDVVVISHDHYDHLDMDSIIRLTEKTQVFLVPLGVGAHLEGWGVPAEKIIEMDWWEERTIDGVRYVCTPARHFSGRGLTDENMTLWASWAILDTKAGGKRIYYSGDTGYHPGFAEIGERLGPFDATLMQIGAYGELWPNIHMTPEEGVRAHKDVRGKLMLPVHYGTFDLAFHAWDEPMRLLKEATARGGVEYKQPRPGEMLSIE